MPSRTKLTPSNEQETDKGSLACNAKDSLKPEEEDEDEYTFSGFGDISLSNICFVPGPPEALSPEKKANKAETNHLFYANEKSRRVLAPCPSTVETDFETIFNNLKRDRQPSSMMSQKSLADIDGGILYSPQPRRLIDLQNFGIGMDSETRLRSDGINEATACAVAPAGRKTRRENGLVWNSNSDGISCHLGLNAVKLT